METAHPAKRKRRSLPPATPEAWGLPCGCPSCTEAIRRGELAEVVELGAWRDERAERAALAWLRW